ncbi:MAG: DinB family protein [Bacteroidia bacterium]|nr:DinB family protein [Bacteroidia bacterium]
MIKQLATVSIEMLQQLHDVTLQLNEKDYSMPLELLNGNTIGKHIRHVYELFDELLMGIVLNEVNYDSRKRNLQIESDPIFSCNFSKEIGTKLSILDEDRALNLSGNFGNEINIIANTSLGRELAYNIEHAIHHMAIIKICLNHYYNYVNLHQNFGIAYSTQNHIKENVHSNLPS